MIGRPLVRGLVPGGGGTVTGVTVPAEPAVPAITFSPASPSIVAGTAAGTVILTFDSPVDSWSGDGRAVLSANRMQLVVGGSAHSAGTPITGTAYRSGTAAVAISIAVTAPVLPVLSLGSPQSVTEGNSGTKTVTWPVTLTPASANAVSATWAVVHRTTDAADFAGPLSGAVAIAAGSTAGSISVLVAGDTTEEPDEGYTIVLSAPVNCTIGTESAGGTILNDDSGNAVPAAFVGASSRTPTKGVPDNFGVPAALLAGGTTVYSALRENGAVVTSGLIIVGPQAVTSDYPYAVLTPQSTGTATHDVYADAACTQLLARSAPFTVTAKVPLTLPIKRAVLGDLGDSTRDQSTATATPTPLTLTGVPASLTSLIQRASQFDRPIWGEFYAWPSDAPRLNGGFNQSSTGDQSYGMLSRQKILNMLGPDVVEFIISANDVSRGTSTANIIARLQQEVAGALLAGQIAIVSPCPHWVSGSGGMTVAHEAARVAANTQARDWVATQDPTRVIWSDGSPGWGAASASDGSYYPTPTIAPDFHPTSYGWRLWENYVFGDFLSRGIIDPAASAYFDTEWSPTPNTAGNRLTLRTGTTGSIPSGVITAGIPSGYSPPAGWTATPGMPKGFRANDNLYAMQGPASGRSTALVWYETHPDHPLDVPCALITPAGSSQDTFVWALQSGGHTSAWSRLGAKVLLIDPGGLVCSVKTRLGRGQGGWNQGANNGTESPTNDGIRFPPTPTETPIFAITPPVDSEMSTACTNTVAVSLTAAAAQAGNTILVKIPLYGLSEVESPKKKAGLAGRPVVTAINPVAGSGSVTLKIDFPAGTKVTAVRVADRVNGGTSFTLRQEIVIPPESHASDGSVSVTVTLSATAGAVMDYLVSGASNCGTVLAWNTKTTVNGVDYPVRIHNEGDRACLLAVAA